MSQAIESNTASPALPATPRVLAQSVGSGFVPVIYHPEAKTEAQRFERLVRKTKLSPQAALRHAERVVHFRKLRTNAAKRKLAAISDEWWLEVVASMGLQPMTVHQAVNRERTGYQGWGNR